MNTSATIAAIVVIILVVGAVLLVFNEPKGTVSQTTQGYGTTGGSTSTNSGSNKVPIAMTDPPQVPSGTSALVVTYSSLQVHTDGGWISTNASGTINLMSIINTSEVIAQANISSGSTINMVRFNVTSAKITINGTTSNVTVPSGEVTAHINGQANVNSSSELFIDMTPVVSVVYNNNSTTFVLAPAARAAIVATAGASTGVKVGSMVSINGNVKASLAASAPNITITSASISTAGNSTTIKVNVKDNSNSSVELNNILVYGPEKVNSTASASSSSSASSNGVLGVGVSANAGARVGLELKTFQVDLFIVSSSGSLYLPSISSSFAGNSGVTINPGSTANLTFSGTVTQDSGHFRTSFVSGSQYKVVVMGQAGASTSTTVTAS